MSAIESKICDAIELLVNRAVEQANYDKTIQATVVEAVDETIGKYLVKYQDSTFYAYAGNSDVTYPQGSNVYILIPGNDTSADKTILGTTKKLGINYVATIDDDEAYQLIGNNCILSHQPFALQSYQKNKQVKVLYSKNNTYQNLIRLNSTAINEYIKGQSTIILGAIVKTSLPAEQQFRGNYGIMLAMNFKDNTNNSIVTRYYTVDVDKMRGNPYKILYDTRQYGIFDIDGENFIEIDSISIFCYDFPNSKPSNECIDDIFIKNIELYGAERLSDDDINNYSITFHTPQGIYFDSSSLMTDTRSIEAQVRVKGKVIDNNSQKLPFYWFMEHAGISSQSTYYNKYGGQGWKCLNDYNIIKKATESDSEVVEWIPASYRWTVSKKDIVAKEVKFKCVVVYEGTVISKTIVIKNLSSGYDITITSSEGTKFYFDIGNPTLKCLINDKEDLNLTYSWAVTNNVGNFETIAATPDVNKAYLTAYNNYYNLLNDIQKEVVLYEPNKARLEQYAQELKKYNNVTRVDGNKIFNLDISSITDFSTYQCSVHQGNLYLGTASITLINSLTAEGSYNVIINNGSCVYKYNENGISPASQAVDFPIEINALTFSVYDNLGNLIDDDVVRHCDIQWLVPIEHSMIEIPSSYPYTIDSTRGVKIYKNIMSLSYNIATRYDINKVNNDIQLIVDYKGMSLSAKTDLVFTKEGDAGTNGTEFFCRIVPNVVSGTNSPLYPILTELSNGSWSLNYQMQQANKFFKVQFWHNDTKIFDNVISGNSTEGKQVVVKWSILRNKYSAGISDSSALAVNQSTGVFTYSGYRSDHPAHIVKAEITYDKVVYYATMPLITVKIKNNAYRAVLKKSTGFLTAVYSSDGRQPRYNNTYPFEITVTQTINGYNEDVSLKTSSAYAVTYTWSYLGRIYEKSWINDIHLIDRKVDNLTKNQKASKPTDSYDGQCVTNALECVIKKGSTEIIRVHIPVHLMLNRYGNAAINGWDGNSVNIDPNGGFILAPQVGAGIKETDNSFTGVVIGKVKETNQTGEDVGLIGYAKGVRSIFLDAKTGKAVFGSLGKGQITIDPTSNKAQIYSGNYSTANKTGMMIDLTTPEIRYGSGNFVVNNQGHLTAKGGGTIAGWNISDTGLWVGKRSATDNTNTGAFLGSDGSINIGSSGKYFRFRNGTLEIKGTLKADEGYIGNWTISNGKLVGGRNSYIEAGNIKGSYIEGGEIYGSVIRGGDDIPFEASEDQVSIGDFYVDSSYGRHTFQSYDEVTGISTGDTGKGDWYMWAGYGRGSGSANTIFLVNTGQVRVEGEFLVNDEKIEDMIKRIHNELGGGSSGCPSQSSGCGGQCDDCDSEGPPCDNCGSGDDWSCDHGSTPCGGECGSQSCGPGD